MSSRVAIVATRIGPSVSAYLRGDCCIQPRRPFIARTAGAGRSRLRTAEEKTSSKKRSNPCNEASSSVGEMAWTMRRCCCSSLAARRAGSVPSVCGLKRCRSRSTSDLRRSDDLEFGVASRDLVPLGPIARRDPFPPCAHRDSGRERARVAASPAGRYCVGTRQQSGGSIDCAPSFRSISHRAPEKPVWILPTRRSVHGKGGNPPLLHRLRVNGPSTSGCVRVPWRCCAAAPARPIASRRFAGRRSTSDPAPGS